MTDVLNESDKRPFNGFVDYREIAPDPKLASAVKCYWGLSGDGDPDSWIKHEAVPDGCVEIIRRFAGRSTWGEEQPALFATGIADRPATFQISGDARFAAIRLWPWAWPMLSDVPLSLMWDRWLPILEPKLAELAALLPDSTAIDRALAERLRALELGVGEAVLASASVAEMRDRSGLSARALQRWFARNVGMSPSHYLRVLRFQKAFATIGDESSLADKAAAHGFADQAHMAREFKALAGTPAGRAKKRATGPFLR